MFDMRSENYFNFFNQFIHFIRDFIEYYFRLKAYFLIYYCSVDRYFYYKILIPIIHVILENIIDSLFVSLISIYQH